MVQELLNTLGFDAGPIDGVLRLKTKAALVGFQSSSAVLKEVLGDSEKEILQQAIELQAPAEESRPAGKLSKDPIRLVQERLKQAGVDPGPVDGIPGANTRDASEYQASHGLSKTGTLDDSRKAARAEENRVMAQDRLETVFRHHAAILRPVFSAPLLLVPVKF